MYRVWVLGRRVRAPTVLAETTPSRVALKKTRKGVLRPVGKIARVVGS